MAAPTISNIVLNRTNAFNGKSISNVTGHLLSFKVTYDSRIPNAFVSISMNGSTQQTTLVDNGDTASFELGIFDAGDSEMITITIEITVDDRIYGRTTQVYQFDVYKYSPPDVTASLVRNDDEQPVLTFKSSFQATVAGAANSLKQFFARVATGDTTNNTDLKGKTSPQVLTGTYDIGKSYTVYIFIQDQVRPSAILKRVVLPSARPVMDIGADGKTVTFFGTSPSSATKETLRIGEVASFGEEVVLGDTSNGYTVVKSSGLEIHNKNIAVGDDTDIIASIGVGDVVSSSGANTTGPFYTLGVRDYNENAKKGIYSTAEGWLNTASGYASHAEGNASVASGHVSHAGGMTSTASGMASFAHGYNVGALSPNQAVFGVNNVRDSDGKYLFIVGNGNDDSGASNAFGVTASGHIDVQKKIYLNTNGEGIFQQDSGGANRELLTLNTGNNLSIGHGQYANGSNGVTLYSGNSIKFKLKSPSASWQPYFAKGDSISLNIGCGGFITNSGKDVWFMIPLSKPVIGNPTVTIASVDGLCVRQNNKYLYGSTASRFVKPSSYGYTLANGGNHIRTTARMANTTNVENNSACGVHATIKVTFS